MQVLKADECLIMAQCTRPAHAAPTFVSLLPDDKVYSNRGELGVEHELALPASQPTKISIICWRVEKVRFLQLSPSVCVL